MLLSFSMHNHSATMVVSSIFLDTEIDRRESISSSFLFSFLLSNAGPGDTEIRVIEFRQWCFAYETRAHIIR